MTDLQTTLPIAAYLQPSSWIDFEHPTVQKFIQEYAPACKDELLIARELFEFVRDKIAHSWDIGSSRVTRTASDVLHFREGICYAKSNLLAALLRGAGVAAGLCYQRLTLGDTPENGMCVHALNTVYLSGKGRWIRLDARGNKPGVNAQFSTNEERLAFPIRPEYGECDYWTNYAEPPGAIAETLQYHDDCRLMYAGGLPEAL